MLFLTRRTYIDRNGTTRNRHRCCASELALCTGALNCKIVPRIGNPRNQKIRIRCFFAGARSKDDGQPTHRYEKVRKDLPLFTSNFTVFDCLAEAALLLLSYFRNPVVIVLVLRQWFLLRLVLKTVPESVDSARCSSWGGEWILNWIFAQTSRGSFWAVSTLILQVNTRWN